MQGVRATWSLIKAGKLFAKACSQNTALQRHISFWSNLSVSEVSRTFSTCQDGQHHVAIVGSGPAGYYTAQQLLKGNSNVIVDVFEKLPVPFGLVRFGVAPDHPEVKNVVNTFTTTGHNDRCNFFGNIEVGKDVSLSDLRNAYSAVVLCYGAADDRLLGIPGEDLPNVLSARSFVGWYNGLPEDVQLPVNLDCESAVILGHGNVALDVARILLTPIKLLEETDISEHALEMLRKSRVKTVHVVGRRGPLQVAFTIKELREMIHLPGTRTIVNPSEVKGLDQIITDLPRPRRRITELMHKTAVSPGEKELKNWAEADKEWNLVFRRTPLEILQNNSGLVSGVKLAVNRLEGESFEKQRAVMTEEEEIIDCGLVLRSIGYKGLPLNSPVPFNSSKGVVDSEKSRVKNEKGLYCAGWIKLGPVGVILTTMTDGFDTGKVILSDMESGLLESNKGGARDTLLSSLASQAVTFQEWEKIDKAEMEQGQKIGKPREKITDVQQMLRVAKS